MTQGAEVTQGSLRHNIQPYMEAVAGGTAVFLPTRWHTRRPSSSLVAAVVVGTRREKLVVLEAVNQGKMVEM